MAETPTTFLAMYLNRFSPAPIDDRFVLVKGARTVPSRLAWLFRPRPFSFSRIRSSARSRSVDGNRLHYAKRALFP